MAIVSVTGKSGKNYQFEDKIIGAGGMKDVYFAPDRSYVVAFFRTKVDAVGKQRLERIVERYRASIFGADGGDYWNSRFCWPTDIVEHNGRTGIVAPTYPKNFFFSYGSAKNDSLNIKGNEKDAKWFASPKLRKMLDERELGTWREYLRQALNLSRAVGRMHAAGLAHSDLSYKNVLVDPTTGEACIIDIDGLVVPGIFPPDVVGTPDFIAPEVMRTDHLPVTDPNRFLPSAHTDKHALAVLIYMYLFYRHPLDGGAIYDATDTTNNHKIMMGEKALFVEHPTDTKNRVNPKWLDDAEKIWRDPAKMPYTIAGPYLQTLFDRAFIDGLHNPNLRPIPSEWETALIKTLDLIQPCSNSKCEMKWYVFDNASKPKCPYCKTAYIGPLPVLDVYTTRDGTTYRAANHRIMVWDGQSIFPYHTRSDIAVTPNMKPEHRKRVGYFQQNRGVWYLVNENFDGLFDCTDSKNIVEIPKGSKIELKPGLKLKLSKDKASKIVNVSLANV